MTGYTAPPGQGYGADMARLLQRVAVLEQQMAQAQSALQTAANPPMFRMRQTIAQSIPSGGSPSIVAMDTPEYDTANGRASGTPWAYTIPAAYVGRWQFIVQVPLSSATANERDVYLFRNGAAVVGSQETMNVSAITSELLVITVPCAAGDVMAGAVFQQSGASVSTFIGTNIMPSFEGRLVSRANP